MCAVGVLDRTEGMLAGSLAKLLLGNAAFDEDHDAHFGALELAEMILMPARCSASCWASARIPRSFPSLCSRWISLKSASPLKPTTRARSWLCMKFASIFSYSDHKSSENYGFQTICSGRNRTRKILNLRGKRIEKNEYVCGFGMRTPSFSGRMMPLS